MFFFVRIYGGYSMIPMASERIIDSMITSRVVELECESQNFRIHFNAAIGWAEI